MSLPLVSVGLPTLERAEILPRALESLLAQTYPNLEIMISDNFSGDETPFICDEYARRHSAVRFKRQTERVPAMANFRTALQLTSGKYFMWASDDDHWDPRFVQVLVDGLEADPNLALLAAEARYRLTDDSLLAFFPEGEYWYESRQRSKFARMLSVIRHNHGNLIYGMYRRDVLITPTGTILDQMRFINEIPVFLRVAETGEIRVVPDVLLFKTTNLRTYATAAREYGIRSQVTVEAADPQPPLSPYREIYRTGRYHLSALLDVLRSLMATRVDAIQKLILGCVAALTLFAHLLKVAVVWTLEDMLRSRRGT